MVWNGVEWSGEVWCDGELGSWVVRALERGYIEWKWEFVHMSIRVWLMH